MAFTGNKKAFCVLEFAKTEKTWRDSLPIDMLLSAVSVLVVAQSSTEIPEGLMNNPVLFSHFGRRSILNKFLIQGDTKKTGTSEKPNKN